jgi:hypothetical protein
MTRLTCICISLAMTPWDRREVSLSDGIGPVRR